MPLFLTRVLLLYHSRRGLAIQRWGCLLAPCENASDIILLFRFAKEAKSRRPMLLLLLLFVLYR